MALNWTDKTNDEDYILAEDVNALAQGIKDNEKSINDLDKRIDNLPSGSSVEVIDNLTSNKVDAALSANQGRTLSYKITSMQGDVNTNTTRINNKVDKSSIYDDLDSDDSSKVLSANQGKVLNDKIGDIETLLGGI